MIPCNDGTPCGFIELIRKQFLCAFKVNNVDWEGIIKHLSGLSYADCIHHQDSLISATVESPIVTKYPVKKSYKRAFLKKLVTEVEKHDIAHPAIYDLYVNLLQSESEKSVEHFKHFVISPDKIITVKESESIISKGTTGLAVWQGGIALTEWAFQHSHLFRGKNILELGCGIGFTGISLCLSEVSPDSYVFTDYHPDVLETLNLNIKINSSEGAVDQLGSTKVKVTALDWEEIDNFSLETSFHPNVVLAADVVYDQTLFDPICKVLNHFLNKPDTFAIFACTVRSEETLEEFLKGLVAAGLVAVREQQTSAKTFFYEKTSPVNIYTVKNGKHGWIQNFFLNDSTYY